MELTAQALERKESEGPAGFERFCAEHPEEAPELCARLAALDAFGLSGAGPGGGFPARLGRFRILRVLGSGGMGVVYLARDEVLGRDLALKTLPPELGGSTRTKERFAREVRAIARLRHPGIVPIYDLHEEGGIPFFSMEYVPGPTLAAVLERLRAQEIAPAALAATDLCAALEEAGAARPERLGRSYVEAACRIAVEVARALDHAHRAGVVHRDVKPSNVILAPDGRARLFDFGLARMTTDERLTLSGDFVGTCPYMPPEVVLGTAEDPDARGDVYSLGATLYELLALRPPFVGRSSQHVLRQIASREPAPLRRLQPQAPADLETIVATALEKDRSRRYASAAELAEDLERLLDLRPIRARPPGPWTRTHRFVRRNPARAAAIGLAALLAVGTPVGLAIANHALAREGERARDAGQASERMLGFLVALLSLGDVEELGPDVTARRLVEEGSDWLLEGTQLADQPLVRARLMSTLGSILVLMSDLERAEALLSAALAIQEPLLGERDGEVARTLNRLGVLRRSQGRHGEAEALHRRALAVARGAGGDEHAEAGIALGNLASLWLARGRLDEAEEALSGLVARSEERETAPRELALLRAHLGDVLLLRDRPEEAEASFRAALAGLEALPRSEVFQALCHLGLGQVELRRGALDAAEEEHREAVDLYVRRLGESALYTAIGLRRLAQVQMQRGAKAPAEATFRRSLESARTALGDDHPEVGYAHWFLAWPLGERGGWQEAEPHLREARRILSRPEAAVLEQDAPSVRLALGECLIALARYAEAEDELLAARADLAVLAEVPADLRRRLLELLIRLYEAQSLPERARPYRDELAALEG